MRDAELIARAAIDPSAAIEATERNPEAAAVPTQAMLRYRAIPGLTMAVEVEPIPVHSRWRFFVFWLLVRLAARVYPFKFELYRTPTNDE